ncbi:MAG TPA: ATP-binding protein [Bacteroidia bacterium]|nr:ATP-binding protein [Bacteroidia bacterium]
MESQERLLKVKFAGRLIDLLGQQMYGGPVPSVAELVANGWDADADKIEISLPADVHAKDASIIVRDYGVGMTFDELNDKYLHIGYERRERGERTKKGRLIMGRKGIGKLAGFGIAEDIVLRSVKDGNLVEFTLNYTQLRSLKTVAEWQFKPDKDEPSKEASGVTVIFRKLKLSKSINEDNFRTSMARRFALGADEMKILVNNVEVKKENLIFEYRYPESGWTDEDIPGFGKIKFWFGFLKDTIQDAELRGISVFARERVAQFTPFFFNLTGGINGQVALEYLTGQVKADFLDEATDYIATDRQTVNWQFGAAPFLEDWGKEKIKELCAHWKKRHTQKKIDRFEHKLSDFFKRVANLSSAQERKDITNALEKIASIDSINEEEFNVIANSMVSGFERESIKKVIQRINATSDEALPALYDVIKEWDIISAVLTAEAVSGKIEIIKQFKKHIDERTPEKAVSDQIDMQKFIREYPWLLGHEYENLKPADMDHEKGVDKWIEEVLNDTNKEFKRDDEKDPRRFDLLCMCNDYEIQLLELVRPGTPADYDHASRLVRYVTRIEDAIESGSNDRYRKKTVRGLLIADDFSKDGSLNKFISTNKVSIDAVEWKTLFNRVHARYFEFLQMLALKAPDDTRLKGIVNLN